MDVLNISFDSVDNINLYQFHENKFIFIIPHGRNKVTPGFSCKIKINRIGVKVATINHVIITYLKNIDAATYKLATGLSKKESIKYFSLLYNVTDANIDSFLFDVVYFDTLSLYSPTLSNSKQLCLKF